MNADREKILEAMENEYNFPGYYPITVIGKSDLKFFAELNAALEDELGDTNFEITQRASTRKNYMSYRIMLHVESAEQALERKEFLRNVEGVLVML